jgi:light-regulated signal transduction histidine kinase (bacteriophytochrome)
LLDFSRLGRKDIVKTEVNMNELTNAAVMELKQLSPNHAKIKIGHLPVLQADYSLMYQVMFNLVSNGIKYSSKKEKPIITINAVQIKDKLTFVIKDNGAGFDMQYANKLFGVFQRLHSEEEFEGNGVGLSIVKRIINKFGGEVWGEGKVDEGATFYFTLN